FSLSTVTPQTEGRDLPIRTAAARLDTPADLPLVPDRGVAGEEPEQALAGSRSRQPSGIGAAPARRTVADLPLFPQTAAGTAPASPGVSPVLPARPVIAKPLDP